ncbi:MAG: DNA translocase FtsK 4TM domain-containing protein, partial [Actinomycetota bacterium]
MATPISLTRQRQILALLLGAFSILALASLATYRAPLPFAPPWTAPNACGPVGATLAFVLVWSLGYVAAFGVPALAIAWSWNRLRDAPVGPLVLRSLLGALMAFEVCTLLGLGGLERQAWSGSWGFAASFALRSALGDLGSWVVGGAVLGVTVLAASELGFRWIAPLLRGALLTPFVRFAGAWGAWRDREVAAASEVAQEAARPAKKPRVVRAPGLVAAEVAAGDAAGSSRPRITSA